MKLLSQLFENDGQSLDLELFENARTLIVDNGMESRQHIISRKWIGLNKVNLFSSAAFALMIVKKYTKR
ncbi:MAG: hypothetical protein IPH20_18085 [Bacteroidales bacterium]|nr:hypothetical protein [Bacteroidales bacterium]